MRVLIAEDDSATRGLLIACLKGWGFESVPALNGREAWEIIQRDDAPRLALIDRVMPGMDGTEVCRRARKLKGREAIYIILLTALGRKEDVVEGLRAGANDYMTKPFDHAELHARIQVGQRILDLQRDLSRRVSELEEALAHIKVLQGTIPICMHCHRIRDDEESWQRVEEYLQEHSDAQLSHSLCPQCAAKYYPQYASKIRERAGESTL